MSRNVFGKVWLSRLCATATILLVLLGVAQPQAREASASKPALPVQTDVDRAEHLVDSQGVPLLRIAGVGEQRHPAWIALYALAYAGVEAYEKQLAGIKNSDKFDACISWLRANLKKSDKGLWVWQYGFDSTYNDIGIKAPWSSAFAQATGIQALLAAWHRDHQQVHLDLAVKASKALFVPLAEGGFLFRRGDDIWFEEIPAPADNPSHILNGHMRVLLALKELADATRDKEVLGYYQLGKETLLRWLPLYDAGYWLRYDLNPRKQDLLFRIVNPYGFAGHALAVDRITLRDPVGGNEAVLDVGTAGDADGPLRIAGVSWGQHESLDGRSVRRLLPAALASTAAGAGSTPPHTYFYLALPGAWRDNLRQKDFELELEYLDDQAANLTVQQRTIAPGAEFRDMRDGDLHLTGSGVWRKWRIPLRTSDLGWWVGQSYAEKHLRYLQKLAHYDARLVPWVSQAESYLASVVASECANETLAVQPLPLQTPVLARFSLDENGVLLQHTASGPTYHPYMVADQLLTQGKAIPQNAELSFDRNDLRREPALAWFLNPGNQSRRNGAAMYQFSFRNAYNDVVSEPPWPSAFSQAYALKAMIFASRTFPKQVSEMRDLAERIAKSFALPTSDGGVTCFDRQGLPFFEEVPNNTHVLNAHLIGISELDVAGRYLSSSAVIDLAGDGIRSLRNHLYLFDTGYWLRYDQNPRKELTFQLDWLEGEESPLIESIRLRNPGSHSQVAVDVGSPEAFDGPVRISGNDWLPDEMVDGRRVRGFRNGYGVRGEALKGAARHNVFFVGRLPTEDFQDDFDVPEHQWLIRYKDVAAGRMVLKVQAISEGNSLQFVPLRGGVVTTRGDQQWKEAMVTVRPQDLGWYKGPDYQTYEVAQLRRIAEITGDWFFSQYAERQDYFLAQQQAGRAAVIAPSYVPPKPPPRLSVRASSPTYPNHGFDNALDGNPNDDYVAGLEGEPEANVKLALEPASSPEELRITWESGENYAKVVKVYARAGANGAETLIGDARLASGKEARILLKSALAIDTMRVVFSDFVGQPRLLLRLLEIR